MTDYAALLAAAHHRSDDDTPRLVLADWLSDHGQDERAEFIRVQIAVSQLTGPDDMTNKAARPTLGRQIELFDFGRKAGWFRCPGTSWVAWIRKKGEGYWRPGRHPKVSVPGRIVVVARGFVEEVHCSPDAWVRHGTGILSRHPLTRLVRLDARPEGSPWDNGSASGYGSNRFTFVAWPGVVIDLPREPRA